jgi:protein-tyrosine-phosphatase/DNA-binding transcriptional ArsR family regulator
MQSTIQAAAPEFLKLLANDIRWQILRALRHSDLRVQELADVVGKPINLVSYHLRLLRVEEVVHERRSSADGRDVYYTLNLPRLQELYRQGGAALHPALGAASGAAAGADGVRVRRVLFVCTQNRARSQMAEAILRHLSGGAVEVQSAGVKPGIVHPLAVEALSEMGIDITAQRSKHLDEVQDQVFDEVITVCDQVREQCPTFPPGTTCTHWSIEDPIAMAEEAAGEDTRRQIFAGTAQELATRIRYFLVAAGVTASGELKYRNW